MTMTNNKAYVPNAKSGTAKFLKMNISSILGSFQVFFEVVHDVIYKAVRAARLVRWSDAVREATLSVLENSVYKTRLLYQSCIEFVKESVKIVMLKYVKMCVFLKYLARKRVQSSINIWLRS